MFAVKQAARCLSHRFQCNVIPKPYMSCLSTFSNRLVRQPTLALSHTYSNNFATAVRETEGKKDSNLEEVNASQPAEPDVLYHMIEIELRAPESAVLKSYREFISLAAQYLDLKIEHCEPGKRYQVKRWTVLKSRHVHRKHMVTYEVRTYHHKIQINRITGSTADTFLEYIQRNLPEGISMRVGRTRMERLPDHLLTPPSDN